MPELKQKYKYNKINYAKIIENDATSPQKNMLNHRNESKITLKRWKIRTKRRKIPKKQEVESQQRVQITTKTENIHKKTQNNQKTGSRITTESLNYHKD